MNEEIKRWTYEQEHGTNLPAQGSTGAQGAMDNRPRILVLPSVGCHSTQLWATDLCQAWCGRDNWLTLALVIDCHTAVAGLATLAQRQDQYGGRDDGAGPNHPLWQLGPRQCVLTAAIGQQPGVHQPARHPVGAQPRPEARTHHPASPATDRNGRTGNPDVEEAMRTPPQFRGPAARDVRDHRLDPVLQSTTPVAGTGLEDPTETYALAAQPVQKSLGHYMRTVENLDLSPPSAFVITLPA